MSVYTVKTFKKGVPYKINWKCEKCMERNESIHTVVLETKSSDKTIQGALHGDENALKELEEKKAQVIQTIAEEEKEQIYSTLDANCKCDNCGSVPSWCAPEKGVLWLIKKAADFLGVIGLIWFLITLLGNVNFLPLLFFIPYVVYYILKASMDSKFKARCKAIAPEFRPMLTLITEEELQTAEPAKAEDANQQ